ncbi:MAG: hydrogenase iron-sulfur subunit [Deltaproteobacteria bacterium]|nr:hydrogenase iron-sulfur subunit [Deltaproteobacteria bacterium]
MNGFEPRVVAFLCNWCSYSAADAAGSARKPHPPNVTVIRLMCSGRMDPQLVLQAFAAGADGVLVLGCHPGDCHYREGNYKARRRHALLGRLLRQLGIPPNRLVLDWVGATESDKFVEVTTRMVEDLRALGPLRGNGPGAQGVA